MNAKLGEHLIVKNPYDNSVTDGVDVAGAEDIDFIVESARVVLKM